MSGCVTNQIDPAAQAESDLESGDGARRPKGSHLAGVKPTQNWLRFGTEDQKANQIDLWEAIQSLAYRTKAKRSTYDTSNQLQQRSIKLQAEADADKRANQQNGARVNVSHPFIFLPRQICFHDQKYTRIFKAVQNFFSRKSLISLTNFADVYIRKVSFDDPCQICASWNLREFA